MFYPRPVPREKACKRCRIVKPIAEFRLPSTDGVDRYNNKCSQCASYGRILQKTKTCRTCKQVKDISEFTYRSPRSYERIFCDKAEARIRLKANCSACRPIQWKIWFADATFRELHPELFDRTPRRLKVNRMRSDELAKFEAKLNRTDTCWLWKGALNAGYGAFCYRGKTIGAHRVAYRHWIGTPPKGLQLDHLCGVRNCVNPWHLQPVTPRENIRRGSKNRSITRQFTQPTSFI